MNAVFCDTVYFLALLNQTDNLHRKALEFARSSERPIVTSQFVLMEVGDALSRPENRPAFSGLLEILSQGDVTIVPLSQNLFEQGCRLFQSRPDKEWSLTDCTSFVIMQDLSITDALTFDHHFTQAGFAALLR